MADSQQSTTPIETLVIFDIEATGLPDVRRQPKITEFCMVAVSRNELMSGDVIPRVVNKLQVCVNPKKPIPRIVSQITGLFNDHLENQRGFDTHLVQLINNFLDRLPPPVCLLAHNGHGFDFPLLKAQILEVNSSLNSDILCSDSLIAFRDLAGEEPMADHLPYLNPKQYAPINPPNTSRHGSASTAGPSSSVSPRVEPVQSVPVDFSMGSRLLNRNQTNREPNIDENMNLSAHILPNQNLPINNNNEQVVDLEAISSASREHEVDQNENLQDMEFYPPENGSPSDEERDMAVQVPQIPVRNGSPDIDEDLMNLDPLNHQFCNENTPNKRPDLGAMAPRKVLPTKQRIEPGRTRRQLNFENGEEEVHFKDTPQKLETDFSYGKTKRRLDFDMDKTGLLSNDSASCHNLRRLYNESGEPSEKRQHTEELQESTSHTELSKDVAAGPAIASRTLQFPSISVEDDKTFLTDVLSLENQCHIEIKPKCDHFDHNTSNKTNLVIVSSHSNSKSTASASTPSKRLSYSLENLYSRVFGHPPEVSHSAEDDCLTVLKLIQRTPGFIDWIDNHSVSFTNIRPMY